MKRIFTSALLALAGAIANLSCAVADDATDQSEWVKFLSTERSLPKPLRHIPAPKYPAEPVQQGYFSIPSYFSPPQVYQRPAEIAVPSGDYGSDAPGLNAFKATLPFVAGGGATGYSGWGPLYPGWGRAYGWGNSWGSYGWGGRGYWGGPYGFNSWSYGSPGFWGATALPTPGLGLGGVPGFGYSPLLPGPGYGGMVPGFPLGGYGWYANPGFGSLMMGAFGNSAARSRVGDYTSHRVIQTAPSKASGNYYAPSTADPTASGSYYATTQPALTPAIPSPRQSGSFWGAGGDPFPKDLNAVPWNK